MRRRSLHEWLALFEAADIPFAPVLTATEAMQSAHAEELQVMREVSVAGHQVRVTGSPVHLRVGDGDGQRLRPLGATPAVGADTASVLRDLGLEPS
jgi:crotonobetainyl-CoA:carnitine CoA-transferase CaiB-like acyl-CoA transferase